MRRILAAVSLAIICCPALTMSARAAEAPKVVSWSNSKTKDSKTVFQVKPGEQITFTVKAKGAEGYRWQVNEVDRNDAGNVSLKWTVPAAKGTWKIRVLLSNRACEERASQLIEECVGVWRWKSDKEKAGKWRRRMRDALTAPEAEKEWIVSTSLNQVKPGQSIQAAADSLPQEGGIVELLPGTHVVSNTITIKRSNLAVVGARSAVVKHAAKDQKGKRDRNCFLIPRGGYHDITFKGFSITSEYTHSYVHLIHGDEVTNFTVDGIYDTSRAFYLAGASSSTRKREHYSRNVVFKNNTTVNRRSHLGAAFSEHVYFINNNINGTMGIDMNRNNRFVYVFNNRVTSGQWNIRIHGGQTNYVIHNNVLVGGMAGICLDDGSYNGLIKNNIVTGVAGKRAIAGISITPQSQHQNVILKNNIIYNNSSPGILTGHYSRRPKRMRISNVTFINNVIYNNAGDGVSMPSPYVNLVLSNNIIANNKGYGINHVGAKINHSYNDIWNNAQGKYKGTTAGRGEMEADPLFANPSEGDFRLKSKAGRWDPKAKQWVKDEVHSPCIDAGDQNADFSREPAPNGGRVNIGAYGNTEKASKSAVR